MPLSVGDRWFLLSYGFVPHYGEYRDRLIKLAQGTVKYMQAKSGLMPDELDLIAQLQEVLKLSTTFADIIADLAAGQKFPGPTDSFWPDYFAGPVAHFIVDTEWQEIVS